MNQLREIILHIKESHSQLASGVMAIKRLEAWKINNFITDEQLDNVAKLQQGIFKDPKSLHKNPLVRASVLARDIHEGAT
jgi:hypothetical protein